MHRNLKTLLLAGAAFLLATGPSNATLQIAATINGANFFCADGQACDTNAAPGVLAIGDITIGGVSFFGSSQTQEFADGVENSLNTSSFQIINNTGHSVSLAVAVGGTDFVPPTTLFSASGGGTFQQASGSSATLTYYADVNNAQGADTSSDTPGVVLASGGPFSGTGRTNSFAFNKDGDFATSGPFSFTLLTVGTLVNGGSLVGRTQAIVAPQDVPEPATLALLGSALLMGGVAVRRRRND
jgi:hypothetical protein